MEKTKQFGLNQWAMDDRIMMKDFNDDNLAIEAALAELQKPPIAVGVLEGYDGSADVTVNLGKQPKMVMVGNRLGWTNIITTSSGSSKAAHAVALPGYPGYKSGLSSDAGSTVVLKVTETGFTVYSGLVSTLAPYYYMAIL